MTVSAQGLRQLFARNQKCALALTRPWWQVAADYGHWTFYAHGRGNSFSIPLGSAAPGYRGHACVYPRVGGCDALGPKDLWYRSGEAARLWPSEASHAAVRTGEAGHSGRRDVSAKQADFRNHWNAEGCRDPAMLHLPGHTGIRSYPPVHQSAPVLL